MTGRLPALLVAGALVLTGCAVDARGELRRAVADLTEQANDRDPDGVRRGVDELLERVDAAVESGELSSAEAARITELALLLRDRADLAARPQEPGPAEEPTEEPEPTREPEPQATEEPEPSEEPEPTQEPEPTEEPEPTLDPTLVPELPTG